jgi:hypothetical protein
MAATKALLQVEGCGSLWNLTSTLLLTIYFIWRTKYRHVKAQISTETLRQWRERQ